MFASAEGAVSDAASNVRSSVSSHLDAGRAVVDRMLGNDPPSQLKSLLAKISPAPKSLPRQYVEPKVAEHTRHGADANRVDKRLQPNDAATVARDKADAIAAIEKLLGALPDDQLVSVVNGLSTREYDALNNAVISAMTGARVAAASTPAQFGTSTSAFIFTAALDLITSPVLVQHMVANIKQAPLAYRLALLQYQTDMTLQRFAQAGAEVHLSQHALASRSKEEVAGARCTIVYAGDNFTPNPFASLSRSLSLFQPEARELFVREMIEDAGTPPCGILAVACVLPDAERTKLMPLIDAHIASQPLSTYFTIGTDYSGALLPIYRRLSAGARAAIDPEIAASVPWLATSLKISASAATRIPKTSPLHRVDRVAAHAIHEDHGFLDDGHGNIDPTKRRAPTLEDRGEYVKWVAFLAGAERLRPDLKDALRLYRHFLIDANGADFWFDYEDYVKGDASGHMTVQSALEDVLGSAQLESDKHGGISEHFLLESALFHASATSTRFPYPATENWQKAIGAHELWSEASVSVVRNPDGTRKISGVMTLHVQDRYNFNPGSGDVASGTMDGENGRFEQSGLGKEFLSKATLTRPFEHVLPAVAGAAAPAPMAARPAPAPKKTKAGHA